ncbi:EAL domain-containing protein [Sulfobacillus thermosulfidooxidans]|uniref:EAL domain-containing protein n=1 Tax=Sulfobacillus thermosulfidooxidans TaxID=28034 RepID=UPI0006B4EDA6|nr:EAL domain-containing protein [Sulfobacillus thermosulfidooxidans]
MVEIFLTGSPMSLNDQNLAEGLALIGWTDQDTRQIAQIPWTQVAMSVVPSFIQTLAAHPTFDRLVLAHSSYPELQRLVSRYLKSLSRSPTTRLAIHIAQRIGTLHVQMGLSSLAFLAAYWSLFHDVIQSVSTSTPENVRWLWAETAAKRMAWDLLVMSSTQSGYFAVHDPLTHLPNRWATEQQLLALMRQREDILVLFADLNGFKAVNDTYGHDAGDQVLQEVAKRWRSVLRASDCLGRWGGDEFLLALPGGGAIPSASHIIDKLLNVLQTPIVIPGHPPMSVSASFGSALFPRDGVTVGEVIHRADQQLYEAKRTRQRWVEYPVKGLTGTVQWVYRIQQALGTADIVVNYQPIIDWASGQVHEWEALVRYRDADGHLHYPGEFLPAIHNHHVLHLLDWAVIEQVFRDLQEWASCGYITRVSVNVTSADLLLSDLFSQLDQWHAHYPSVRPDHLGLEILESAALVNPEHMGAVLQSLRQQGYRIALDDFGTGYSSLSHLQRLPIDYVKIDRSFIQDWQSPAGRGLIQAMIGMRQPFGYETIGEGVETLAQHESLRAWGCTLAQGWLYSPARDRNHVPFWQWVGDN